MLVAGRISVRIEAYRARNFLPVSVGGGGGSGSAVVLALYNVRDGRGEDKSDLVGLTVSRASIERVNEVHGGQNQGEVDTLITGLSKAFGPAAEGVAVQPHDDVLVFVNSALVRVLPTTDEVGEVGEGGRRDLGHIAGVSRSIGGGVVHGWPL